MWCVSHVICYSISSQYIDILPLTPPDPTLNVDNLLRATRGIPLWRSEDSLEWLNMPCSLHEEIKKTFDGEEGKRVLFTKWLAGHPCPTWDKVERLLRLLESGGRGREGASHEVKETYLKSELHYY